MSNHVGAYEARIELVKKNRGESRTTLYTATGATDATESAVRFAKRMLENERITLAECPEEYVGLTPEDIQIGAVQVNVMHFGPIDEHGSPHPARGLCYLFEWKRDYPASLDDYVEDLRRRTMRATTNPED